MKKWLVVFFVCISLAGVTYYLYDLRFNRYADCKIGDPIDSLNHVKVYYNGPTGTIVERNTVDGYNIGLKYQCVEFVKRYYFEYYKHRMPDPYGNAVDFFNPAIKDGKLNPARDLVQFTNPSSSKPQVGDLIVMDGDLGHVCIVSAVAEDELQIIQQNGGQYAPTRKYFDLENTNATWHIDNERILGWLRMK